MGLSHSPKIVTNGLVVCLDPVNSKSFRGGPTTNLTRNHSNFTGSNYASSDEYIYLSGNLNKTYVSNVDTPVGQGATRISIDGNYGYHYLSRWGEGGTGDHYLSCYVKPLVSGITNLSIAYVNAGSQNKSTNFNLDTNEITFGSNILTQSAFIEDVKGWPGWKRMGAKIEGYAGGWVGSIGYNSLVQFQGTDGDKPLLITGVLYETGSFTHFIGAQESRGTTVATGGGWADISANSNHGELVNGVIYGRESGSLVFDGSNDHISNSTLSSMSEYTISMWINRDGTQSENYPGLVAFGTYSPGFYLEFNSNGYVSYYRNGISVQTLFSKSDIAISTWYNIVFKKSGSTITSYLNAAEKGSITDTISTATGFGFNGDKNSTPTWTTHWGGEMANAMIYSRALTADEIKQNFEALRGRFNL